MYILVAFQFSISLSSSVSDLKWWKRRSMSLQPQRKRRPLWWMKRKLRRTTPDIRSHWTSRLLQQMSNVEMKMSVYSSWRLSSIPDISKCSWKLQESRLLFLSVLSKKKKELVSASPSATFERETLFFHVFSGVIFPSVFCVQQQPIVSLYVMLVLVSWNLY